MEHYWWRNINHLECLASALMSINIIDVHDLYMAESCAVDSVVSKQNMYTCIPCGEVSVVWTFVQVDWVQCFVRCIWVTVEIYYGWVDLLGACYCSFFSPSLTFPPLSLTHVSWAQVVPREGLAPYLSQVLRLWKTTLTWWALRGTYTHVHVCIHSTHIYMQTVVIPQKYKCPSTCIRCDSAWWVEFKSHMQSKANSRKRCVQSKPSKRQIAVSGWLALISAVYA